MALTSTDQQVSKTINLALNGSEAIFYNEPSTTVAKELVRTVKSLVASTNDQAVNLATLFPALTSIKELLIREITGTALGFKVGTAAGAGKLKIGTRKSPISIPVEDTALPTLYFDNTNVTAVDIEFVVIGS